MPMLHSRNAWSWTSVGFVRAPIGITVTFKQPIGNPSSTDFPPILARVNPSEFQCHPSVSWSQSTLASVQVQQLVERPWSMLVPLLETSGLVFHEWGKGKIQQLTWKVSHLSDPTLLNCLAVGSMHHKVSSVIWLLQTISQIPSPPSPHLCQKWWSNHFPHMQELDAASITCQLLMWNRKLLSHLL